jgi:hypothetical protein
MATATIDKLFIHDADLHSSVNSKSKIFLHSLWDFMGNFSQENPQKPKRGKI